MSERKMKEVLPRSVKFWLKTSFLRFSVWKQHMDCLEKMPSLLTLIWRKLFLEESQWSLLLMCFLVIIIITHHQLFSKSAKKLWRGTHHHHSSFLLHTHLWHFFFRQNFFQWYCCGVIMETRWEERAKKKKNTTSDINAPSTRIIQSKFWINTSWDDSCLRKPQGRECNGKAGK